MERLINADFAASRKAEVGDKAPRFHLWLITRNHVHFLHLLDKAMDILDLKKDLGVIFFLSAVSRSAPPQSLSENPIVSVDNSTMSHPQPASAHGIFKTSLKNARSATGFLENRVVWAPLIIVDEEENTIVTMIMVEFLPPNNRNE